MLKIAARVDSDGDFSLGDFQKKRLFFGIQGKKSTALDEQCDFSDGWSD